MTMTEGQLLERVRWMAPFMRWSVKVACLPMPSWCPQWARRVRMVPLHIAAALVRLQASW